jgi:hypothetical protein
MNLDRLQLEGYAVVRNFRDTANAFPSLDHAATLEQLEKHVYASELTETNKQTIFNILCDHVEKHVFTLKAHDAIMSFRGNVGVLPGSSVGNQLFNLGVWPAQAKWASQRSAYAEHLWIETPWHADDGGVPSGETLSQSVVSINTAVTTFVDDCGACCTADTAAEAFLYDGRDDTCFDACLAEVGLAQNSEKSCQTVRTHGGFAVSNKKAP